ncbi:hypothetical protein [Legionella londiniensis]|uniref:hypothetical protein n=1 Tax=Legionella londiniensis TaxID=45068 RepID=UPI00399C9D78
MGYPSFESTAIGQFFFAIKKRLEKAKFGNSSDEINAQKQINTINKIITILSQDILYYFDNGYEPNILQKATLLGKKKELTAALNEIGFFRQMVSLYLNQQFPEITKQCLQSESLSVEAKEGYIKQLKVLLCNQIANDSSIGSLARMSGDQNLLKDLLDCFDKLSLDLDDFYDSDNENIKEQALIEKIQKDLPGLFFGNHPPLKITHQETYGFIKEIFEKLSDLPPTLQDLLPFLNPDAISTDLSGSLVAKLTAGIPIKKIEHTGGFKYRLVYKEEKKEDKTIDANAYFQSFLPKISEFLAEVMGKYYQDYSESQHVKHELSKNRLINDLIKKETIISEEEKLFIEACHLILTQTVQDNSFEEKLGDINKLDQSLENQVEAIDKRILKLQQRLRDYKENKISQFCAEHQINPDGELDLNHPLPAAIVIQDSSNFKAVEVRKTLEAANTQKMEELQQSKKKLLEKREEVTRLRQDTIKSFLEEEIRKNIGPIQELQQNILKLTENFAIKSSSKEIEEQIQQLLEQQRQLIEHKKSLNEFKVKESICSEILQNADNTALETIQKAYQAAVSDCEKEIESATQTLELRTAELQSSLEKAKQRELLESCNAEMIGRFIDDKKQELSTIIEKNKQIDTTLTEIDQAQDWNFCPLIASEVHGLFKQIESEIKEFAYRKKEPEQLFAEGALLSVKGASDALYFVNNLFINYETTKEIEKPLPPKRGDKDYKLKLNVYETQLLGYQIWEKTNRTFLKISKMLDKMKSKLQDLQKPVEIYESNLKKKQELKKLRKEYDENASAINAEVEVLEAVKPVLEKLETLNQKTNELSGSPSELISSLVNFLNEIRGLQSDYEDLTKLAEKIAKLKNKDHYEQMLQTAEKLLTGLQSRINNKIKEELGQYSSQVAGSLQAVDEIAFDETKAIFEKNQQILEERQRFLSQLPGEELLQRLKQEITKDEPLKEQAQKIDEILENKVKLTESLEKKALINKQLGERVKEREALVTKLSQELDDYIQNRNDKYRVKDTFFAGDKSERESFISELKQKLQHYSESNSSKEILDYIEENKSKFIGFNLQSLLNRIALGLTDLAKKVAANYEDEQVAAESPMPAQEILRLFKGKQGDHLAYAEAIEALYGKIQELDRYGSTLKEDDQKIVHEHAESLKTRVDGFVTAHSDDLPSKEQMTAFQKEFRLHLHSKDDIMCKHDSWKPLIANIALAVFTLGIALGIQLIASKVSTGRFAFFMDRSERLRREDAIEEKLAALEMQNGG